MPLTESFAHFQFNLVCIKCMKMNFNFKRRGLWWKT